MGGDPEETGIHTGIVPQPLKLGKQRGEEGSRGKWKVRGLCLGRPEHEKRDVVSDHHQGTYGALWHTGRHKKG